MGNSNLSMGYPQRPGLIGARDLRAILALRREKEADISYATYVRPLGDNQHLVKKECNDQFVRVGSLNPGSTWSPGSIVILVSNTGHKDDVIAGSPPLGKKGGSLAPSVPSLRSLVTPAPPPEPPPITTLDNQMMGFWGDGAGMLHCWEYDDAGLYVGDVASANMGAIGAPDTALVLHQRIVHDAAGSGMGVPILMFNTNTSTTGTSGLRAIVVWDLLHNDVILINPTMTVGSTTWSVGPPFVLPGESSGYLYFLVHDNSASGNLKTRLWRAKMDGSDTPIMVCDLVDAASNGVAQSSVLFNDTYVYAFPGGSAITRYLTPPGSSVSLNAYGSASSATFAGPCYWSQQAASIDYWHAVNARRQKRIVGDPSVTFKLAGANAFTLDAPNTSTTNRATSINRTRDTSLYFPWSASPTFNIGKLGQPAGDSTASGHTTAAPLITFDPHPTHGLPHFVHLNQFANAW